MGPWRKQMSVVTAKGYVILQLSANLLKKIQITKTNRKCKSPSLCMEAWLVTSFNYALTYFGFFCLFLSNTIPFHSVSRLEAWRGRIRILLAIYIHVAFLELQVFDFKTYLNFWRRCVCGFCWGMPKIFCMQEKKKNQ